MGDSSNVAAGAYSNSLTQTARPAGPAAPETYGSNWLGYGATAAGGLTKALAQDRAGRANQRLARINAHLARTQADQAIQAGDFAANRVATKEAVMEGADRARQAAGGTVVGAGTSRLVAASSKAAAMADEQMIRLNARRQAYGFNAKASIDDFEGKLARQGGRMAAAETLLNTGDKLWQESDNIHRLEFG